MKKFLSVILAVLIMVTTVPVAFAADKTVKIEMADVYGDSWDGAAIIIEKSVDGTYVEQQKVTLEAYYYSNTVEFAVSDIDKYRFVWQKGDYDEECSFSITIDGLTYCEFSNCYYIANGYVLECECNNYKNTICEVCGEACKHKTFIGNVCSVCRFECDHTVTYKIDGNIMTPYGCLCTVYSSDSRWTTGTYEDIAEGYTAQLRGFDRYDTTDELVAYFVLRTVDGAESFISFDWAINQGFLAYGSFKLHFYHNDKEVISYDFTSEVNDYKNIMSERYEFTAEGDIQIFKFVYEKVDNGWWADTGRTAYLGNIQYIYVEEDESVNVDENENICDKCGEAHDNIFSDIICWFKQFFTALRSFLTVIDPEI